jgi:hypothetical protein
MVKQECSNTPTLYFVKTTEFCSKVCIITTISNQNQNNCILGINVSEWRHCTRFLWLVRELFKSLNKIQDSVMMMLLAMHYWWSITNPPFNPLTLLIVWIHYWKNLRNALISIYVVSLQWWVFWFVRTYRKRLSDMSSVSIAWASLACSTCLVP